MVRFLGACALLAFCMAATVPMLATAAAGPPPGAGAELVPTLPDLVAPPPVCADVCTNPDQVAE